MSFKTDKHTLTDLAIFAAEGKQSVYEIFNHTQTRGGSRILEDIFQYPLSDKDEISRRSEAIRHYQKKGIGFPFRPAIFDTIEFYLGNTDSRSQLSIEDNTWERKVKKVIKAYQKIDLLILDEFLLSPVSTEQTRELLEIIEARSVKGSVIFCTQFEPKGWYSRIGNDCDATICEAIIDRIIHNSYEVMLDGRISMRERHGIHASRKGAAND